MSRHNRFVGNPNAWVGDPGKSHRGWQLTCSKCDNRSEIVASHNYGSSLSPESLRWKFEQRGWQVSQRGDRDLCGECKQTIIAERRAATLKADGKVADEARDMIHNLDKFLTYNACVYDFARNQDILHAFVSLLETAYFADLLEAAEKERLRKPQEEIARTMSELSDRAAELALQRQEMEIALRRDRKPLDEAWQQAAREERIAFCNATVASFIRSEQPADNGGQQPMQMSKSAKDYLDSVRAQMRR